MADNRIVVARFMLGEKNSVTTPIYQYNYGNVLRFEGLTLPSTFEVHFSNDQFGEATTSIGTDNEVVIPDMYLTDPGDLYAWVFLHDTADDGETMYQVMIPLIARAEISDEPPTPEQQSAITQAIAALNEAVEDCEACVEHYPEIGENGDWYVYDAETDEMVDSGVHAQGEQGEPGTPGADGQDGADGKDGNALWYSTKAPTQSQDKYNFIMSNLVGDSSRTAIIGDIIFYESVYYSVTSIVFPVVITNRIYDFKGADGQNGADGQDGNALWYSDLPPVLMSNVFMFLPSGLHGDSSREVAIGDIIFYESVYYSVFGFEVELIKVNEIYNFKGANGQNGYSPTATVSKSGSTATITITDKNGTTTATVSDGDPSDLINDTTASSSTTFSSDKIVSYVPLNLSGSTAPASGTGKDGDVYYQIDSGEVLGTYLKVSGAWVEVSTVILEAEERGF